MVLPQLVVDEMLAGVRISETESGSKRLPVTILRCGGIALAMGGYATWRWWRDR